MDQPKLFYDSYQDALKDDVNAVGGPKEVGRWFWPEKNLEAARNRVNDCLNANRGERFTDEQERLIMRRARAARGYSAALYFICDDAEFERPVAKSPEDERVKLQRRVIEAAASFKQDVDRLERLTRQAPQADK